MTLFWQQFKAQFTGLLIWSAIGAGLMLMMARIAPSYVEMDLVGDYLASLPESMVKMMGLEPGMDPLDSFVAAQVGKSLVLITPLYAVMLALSAVTREVDRRTIDFLLALPVRRADVILSRAAVMLLNTALATAAMGAAMYLSFIGSGLEGNWAGYNLLFLNVWLLGAAVGSIALLASLWIDDYGVGVKVMLGLVSGAYFLEFVFRAVGMSRTARLLSPFSYVDATVTLRDGVLPVSDVLILLAVTAGCIALSVPVFEKKQIAA